MATAIAAIRSGLTYLFIATYVLIIGPPGMVLALLFRWKSLLYTLGHIGIGGALALAGIRYRIVGREHLTRVGHRAAVYCANHVSNVDPPVLFRALHRRMHVVFKAELLKLPVLGRALLLGEFVPIDRGNREQSRAAIDAGARSLAAGNSFLFFPEGTRSRTGELLPFKKGGFVMAIKAQAPVVPVAVSGGRDSMRKGSAIVRPVTVTIQVGEPVETVGLALADRDELVGAVRRKIEEMLDRVGTRH